MINDPFDDELMGRIRRLAGLQLEGDEVVPVEVKLGPVDHYGRGLTSPIAPPTARTGGERVPGPGLPPGGVPPYLKPIPINTRDIEAVFRAHLSDTEPRVMRELYSTWNAQAEPIKDQEWRNALRDGTLTEQRWAELREEYAQFVDRRLSRIWEWSQSQGAHRMAAAMERLTGVRSVPFEKFRDKIESWIYSRGADLVVDLSTAQRSAIRSVLVHYGTLGEQVNVRELGRLLRPLVGLTPAQARSVAAFRDRMAKDPDVSARKREHLVGNYLTRLRRIRAERIARTEVAFAFNYGGLNQVRSEVNFGALMGKKVQKRWQTADDERVCAWCRGLDEKVIQLEEVYPAATQTMPVTYVPPAHPNCRCTVGYEVLGGLEARAIAGEKPRAPGLVPGEDRDTRVTDKEVAEAVAKRRAELDQKLGRSPTTQQVERLLADRQLQVGKVDVRKVFELQIERGKGDPPLTKVQKDAVERELGRIIQLYGLDTTRLPATLASGSTGHDRRPVLKVRLDRAQGRVYQSYRTGYGSTRPEALIHLFAKDFPDPVTGAWPQTARVLWHETGHFLETMNAAHGDAAQRYLILRAEQARVSRGLTRRPVRAMSWSAKERGYDVFPDLYTGKLYGGGGLNEDTATSDDIYATEITSMALEMGVDPARLRNAWVADPEWVSFWWASVNGDFGYQAPITRGILRSGRTP